MLFGITEKGDPSLDYAWVKKMEVIDGSILITKNLTDKFIEEVLKVKEKVIIHVSCTGYGGTILEPNLPNYKIQLDKVKELINLGFPKEQIVIRIDPIIPTKKGIEKVERIVNYIYKDIQRFRVSVIDLYPHVKQRFKDNNLPIPFEGFQATEEQFSLLDSKLKELRDKYNVTFESCAEIYLYSTIKTGCVAKRDIELLGLTLDNENLKGQRPGCLCCSAKTELLEHKQIDHYGCGYKCLYCYWR